MSDHHRGQRILIGGAAGGAALHVATLVPTAWSLLGAVDVGARPVILTVSLSLVIALGACGLAAYLVTRAGHLPEARGLALFLVMVAVCWGSVLRFASLDLGPDGRPVGLDISISDGLLWTAILALALACASLWSLSLRFPADLTPEDGSRRRWSRRSGLPWALALVAPLVVPAGGRLAMGTAGVLGAERSTLATLFPWVLGITAAITGALLATMLLAAVVEFTRGYRRAEESARRRATWLLVGLVGSTLLLLAAVLVVVLEGLLPIRLGLLSRYSPLVVLLAPLFMLVAVTIAIFHAGALDPRLALRRSTISGISGTAALLVFAGLENSLSGWVEGRLGLPGTVGSFLAGALSAAVFLPVQHRLGRVRRATLPPAEG